MIETEAESERCHTDNFKDVVKAPCAKECSSRNGKKQGHRFSPEPPEEA